MPQQKYTMYAQPPNPVTGLTNEALESEWQAIPRNRRPNNLTVAA